MTIWGWIAIGIIAWLIGNGIVIAFNYAAHYNDPPDWKG